MITTALALLGGFVVSWFVTGVVLFTYTKVVIYPGTPWPVRALAVFHAGWFLPWNLLSQGRLPKGAMIVPEVTTPEEVEEMARWMASLCECEDCVQRRGE